MNIKQIMRATCSKTPEQIRAEAAVETAADLAALLAIIPGKVSPNMMFHVMAAHFRDHQMHIKTEAMVYPEPDFDGLGEHLDHLTGIGMQFPGSGAFIRAHQTAYNPEESLGQRPRVNPLRSVPAAPISPDQLRAMFGTCPARYVAQGLQCTKINDGHTDHDFQPTSEPDKSA